MGNANPERNAIIVVMAADGMSCSEIGAKLGITKNAVVGVLHRAAKRGLRAPDFSCSPHDPQTSAALTQLWLAGVPAREIAAQLSITRDAVYRAARHRDLPRRPIWGDRQTARETQVTA